MAWRLYLPSCGFGFLIETDFKVGLTYKIAKKILRHAGALGFYTMAIETFSHGYGTCAMGKSADTSAVNETGRCDKQ